MATWTSEKVWSPPQGSIERGIERGREMCRGAKSAGRLANPVGFREIPVGFSTVFAIAHAQPVTPVTNASADASAEATASAPYSRLPISSS